MHPARGGPDRSRYTVVGRWKGKRVRLVLDRGRLVGPADVVTEISSKMGPGQDLRRLSTALALIDRSLDEVTKVRVDDGGRFAAADELRPESALRRKLILRARVEHLPTPPQTA